ncbi:MAG TPA: metalloregulator ArsR/SmtB family transcription factor [Ktedonobacteraceae bacterium]|nr:metalloregulator ArsR/SmtB family transcription factor [Ktedonobacteraceae bacterium]
MAAQNVPLRRQALIVEVEAAPAYEFLISLCVFNDACGDFHSEVTYDVGKAWFEEVRAKASPDLLANVEQFSFHSHQVWEHIFSLAYECPPPRDVPTFIEYLETIDALELRLHLLGYYVREHRRVTPPETIYAAAQGDSEAQKKLLKTSFPDDAEWQKTLRWLLALDMAATKNMLLDILRRWYDEVFREQEPTVLPILARDVEAKRALRATMSPEQLIETCTGWEYVPEPGIKRVVLIPSYINRPYNSDAEHHGTRIFYFPVADESVVAGNNAPPVRLLRLAKALADERRLRILKKLSTESYTLQELADDFGVAKTTMHHHLITLRSAGLVRMRLSDKRYSLRPDVLDSLGDLLSMYLK